MLKMKGLMHIGVCAIALPMVAHAASFKLDPHPYVGVNVSRQHVNIDGVKPNIGIASLQVGVNLNSYLALEARAGHSFKNGSFTEDDASVDHFKMNHQYAAYLKMMLPTGYRVKPYLLAGYSWSRFDEKNSADGDVPFGQNHFAWGLGAQIKASTHTFVTVEYIDQGKATVENTNIKFNQIGLSANYLF
ncbi:MAG: hypothetical protein CENE_01953 [Candidatus Celerinatantimonas neptuna]|nr:MAG: hypothetical protein CENE_01953 [Candidatus Celerinatantimonas neptuna]